MTKINRVKDKRMPVKAGKGYQFESKLLYNRIPSEQDPIVKNIDWYAC